jgi:GNAT superfamily N-acetyltransferase
VPIRLTALSDPAVPPGHRRPVWLADDGGTPVGTAALRLPDAPDRRHLAELELTVHPAERRRGTGRALLAAAAAAARADGRRTLRAEAEEGSPGEAFLAACGLVRALSLTVVRLPLAEADEAALTALAERPHPGYRLVSWEGAVPDEWVDRYVAARPAMDDMPTGDGDFGTVHWDADRLRAAAAAVAARGAVLHTVAVLAEPDGAMVGFTELVVPGAGGGEGQHYGTAVLPAHRGRGLARWMKAESVRTALRREAPPEGLVTDTADGNVAMRRVNEGLGYRPVHRIRHYRLDL